MRIEIKQDLKAAAFFGFLLLVVLLANGEKTMELASMMGWWG